MERRDAMVADPAPAGMEARQTLSGQCLTGSFLIGTFLRKKGIERLPAHRSSTRLSGGVT